MTDTAGDKKRFLIFKLGALGDVIFAIPAAQAIKHHVPNAHVTWVTGRAAAGLLKNNPYIDELVEIDEKLISSPGRNPAAPAKNLLRLRAATAHLRTHRYEKIFVLYRNPLYFALVHLLVSGQVLGISRPNPKPVRGFLNRAVLNRIFSIATSQHTLSYPPHSLHESLIYKDVVAKGLKLSEIIWNWDLAYLTLQPAPSVNTAEHPLPARAPDILLHIGGGKNLKTTFELKQWPHFEELVTLLLQRTPYTLGLIGGPDDLLLSEKIMRAESTPPIRPPQSGSGSLSGQSVRLQNFVGALPFHQLAPLIAQAKLFIGTDSGPLHLADALNTPSIGLFGPTSTISWGLLNARSQALTHPVSCAPCYLDDGVFPPCPHSHKCMKSLTAEQVFRAVQSLVVKPGAARDP